MLIVVLFFPQVAAGQTETPADEPSRRVVIQEIVLPEPSIAITPDVYYPLEGEFLYIEGRSVPGAIISLVLQKQGDKPVKFTTKADSFGEWVVSEKTYLAAGTWEVRARQQVKSEVSDWSNPRVIRSVVTGVNILGFNVRYVVIALILLVFFAVIGGILIYFLRKIRGLKRGLLERQLHDTEMAFHENVSAIRKDLMAELQALVQNAQARPLTGEELAKRDRILQELDGLERNMEHSIQDIGRRI